MRLQVLLMNFDVSLKSSQQDRERKKEMAISHLSTQGSLALTKIRCLKVGEENREEEMDEDTVRWTESEAGMAKRSWEMEKKATSRSHGLLTSHQTRTNTIIENLYLLGTECAPDRSFKIFLRNIDKF